MKMIENSVPARYFALLADYLEANGMPCRDALSAANVRTLNDPQALLTAAQVEALIPELIRLSGRSDLAFELGRQIKFTSHDLLGFAIASAATLDHMLRLVSRYYRLITPMFRMRYLRHADHVEMLLEPTMAMSETVLNFHLESAALAAHMRLMAATDGQIGAHDIYLSIPEPAHVHRYRALTPARFHFSALQMGMRIVIDSAGVDQHLPMKDQRAFQQAEARCKLLLQELSRSGQWSAWVAMMLREADDSQPTLEDLANILNISVRTLDRYLQSEGVSFRTMAISVRNERARQMLASGTQSVTQIAYRLGYSDMANFCRSFKKINGMSPLNYQASQSNAG